MATSGEHMKFIQHIPGFIDTDEPPIEASFDSVEELVKIPWIAKWVNDPRFYKLWKEDDSIIVEYNGCWFWVLGFVDDSSLLMLDEFVVPEKRAKNRAIYASKEAIDDIKNWSGQCQDN